MANLMMNHWIGCTCGFCHSPMLTREDWLAVSGPSDFNFEEEGESPVYHDLIELRQICKIAGFKVQQKEGKIKVTCPDNRVLEYENSLYGSTDAYNDIANELAQDIEESGEVGDAIYDAVLAEAYTMIANRMQPAIQKYGLDANSSLWFMVTLVGVLVKKEALDTVTPDIEPEKIITPQDVTAMLDQHEKPLEVAFINFLSYWQQGLIQMNSYPFTLEETWKMLQNLPDEE